MNHIIWSTGHPIKHQAIVKASNCTLEAADGSKYIDLESGVWCTSVGHCNPRITLVIQEQSEKIIHTGFNYLHPMIETAAIEILKIAGLAKGKCEFLCSGSEAVEYCMRIAKSLTPNAKILTFADSYFGAYGEATHINQQLIRYNWLDCACQHPQGCQATCADFDQIPFHEINTFLFEPGSSSGLVRFPSRKLIDKITRNIKKQRGIIISNEITTGIGRTAKWFGFQHYPIKPDMVAIGKGIGNGYPVSVAVISHKVAKKLDSVNFHYSQSHQNDPLGAAVALEVIKTIEENDLMYRSKLLSNKCIRKLRALKMRHPIIKDVRGRGLMIVIEFENKAEYIQNELFKKGFMIAKRSGHEALRLDPALTIEKNQLNGFLNQLEKIIKKLP